MQQIAAPEVTPKTNPFLWHLLLFSQLATTYGPHQNRSTVKDNLPIDDQKRKLNLTNISLCKKSLVLSWLNKMQKKS